MIIPATNEPKPSNIVPSNIYVGPAGWNYRDWAGVFYPRKRGKDFSELNYLSRFFDVAEINTSFYGAVRQSTAEKWLRQIEDNKRFQFTAKLHQVFTHQTNPADSDERDFRIFADVLASGGRLGALLAQFPWSFKNTPENRAYLDALLERFKEYPMVVEARHSSWDDPKYLELLAGRGAGFCNIDQPVIGKSLGPTALTTSRVGYVRLHGRNYKEWFADSGRDARYNYFYTNEELTEWKDRIIKVADQIGAQSLKLPTFVITNNHYEGRAAANALQLISMLDGIPTPAPASMIEAYPPLAEFTTPVSPQDLPKGSAEPLPTLFV